MESHDDRFDEIVEVVIGAFYYIKRLLLTLPIPVAITDFDPTGDDQFTALLSLDRVRELVEDEPISKTAKSAWESLILEWFTAYEMAALVKVAGPAPWRLDSVEYALVRLAALGEAIEQGELDDDES